MNADGRDTKLAMIFVRDHDAGHMPEARQVPKLQISFASCPYDRLNPIMSGRVPIEGCDVNFFPLRPEELFPRVYHTQDFDVTELSASSHILTSLRGDANYLGIPAFVSRVFRHGDIYIAPTAGLAHRRICAARSSAFRNIR
jgi:hypothetical protein